MKRNKVKCLFQTTDFVEGYWDTCQFSVSEVAAAGSASSRSLKLWLGPAWKGPVICQWSLPQVQEGRWGVTGAVPFIFLVNYTFNT